MSSHSAVEESKSFTPGKAPSRQPLNHVDEIVVIRSPSNAISRRHGVTLSTVTFDSESRYAQKLHQRLQIFMTKTPERCDRIIIGKDTRLFARHKLIASQFGHLPRTSATERTFVGDIPGAGYCSHGMMWNSDMNRIIGCCWN